MANLLTLVRVALIFLVVAVWARKTLVELWWLDVLMVVLLAWAIFLDAVDGWVARRRHEESEIGALLDIAGDRVVELVLWVFFSIRRDIDGNAMVPYWVPFVIIVRTVATDLVRSIAFQGGKTPFGATTMMESPWARQLVASRWSRAAYGGMKTAVFCALGLVLAFERMHSTGAAFGVFRIVTDVLVYATTIFCVVRGVPVLWDGRHYFAPPPSRRR